MLKTAVIVLNYRDSDNAIRISKKYSKMKVINKVILVDNVSPDNSYDKFKKLKENKIDAIQAPENKGYSSGNNYGIKYLNENYGEYDYIIISNPDVDVEENAIKACVDFLDKHKDYAIAAPKMLMINDIEHPLSGWKLRTPLGDLRDSSNLLTKIFKKPHIEMYDKKYMQKKQINVDCVAGSFFVIKNEVFKKIGYFDEKTFLYFEEDIIGKKLHNLGYKNIILNNYKFKHFESVSVDRSMNYIKKYKNLQKSKIYYHKKYTKCNLGWLMLLYLVTFLVILNFYFRIFLKKMSEFIFRCYKVLILCIIFITLPINFLLKRRKVLYYSIVNWKWIKQRPHFVPEFLSKNGYKMTYMYDTPYENFIEHDSNNIVENKTVEKNLRIKTWKFIPYHLSLSKINRYIFVTRMLFMNYDKIIFTSPKQISNLFQTALKLRGTKIYYECMDNYVYWENENEVNFFQGREKWLIDNCEKVIVSSNGLRELFVKKYNCPKSKITLIRNGYDKKIFENIKKTPLVLKPKNAVYIGTVDEWFDFDSIEKYAKKYSDITFYIIGPVGFTVKDKVKNNKIKNIIYHGPIEHKYVPDTIRESDVMLLPFLINPLIEDVDPVKVYEYLFMKKPVVSSYWKELDQFSNFVEFYNNYKEFEKAMNKAFKEKIEENNEYKKLMKESAWDERLKDYLKAIK